MIRHADIGAGFINGGRRQGYAKLLRSLIWSISNLGGMARKWNSLISVEWEGNSEYININSMNRYEVWWC